MKLIARAVAALVLLAALVHCGNPSAGEDTRYLVLDYNADAGRYEAIESTIETLDNIESVAGEIAYVRGGGDIQAGSANPRTEAEFRKALTISGDETPQAKYDINDGVVEAWDFHSFLMITLYHHLEKAAFYFEEIGVARDTVGRMPVYYSPKLSVIIPINLLTDNAAYAFTLDAFLIPPQFAIEGVPLGANRGVIVHEYSHAVFNRLVHHDARAPEYLLAPWPDASINRMRALDEGVADIFAGLATGDANFIGPSISEETFDIDRDLSKTRYYTRDLRDEVERSAPNSFNPYKLGSVVASTVWALRATLDDQALGEVVVATLRDFAQVDADFGIVDFFDRLHANLPAGVGEEACAIFRDRLTVISEELACAQ